MQHLKDQFKRVTDAYAGTDHLGSASLLLAIKNFIDSGMIDCGFALAAHGVDVQSEDDPFGFLDKTWTEVYLEVFRRSFYDEASATLYGTEFVVYDPNMLEIVTAGLLGDAEVYSCGAEHINYLAPSRTVQ